MCFSFKNTKPRACKKNLFYYYYFIIVLSISIPAPHHCMDILHINILWSVFISCTTDNLNFKTLKIVIYLNYSCTSQLIGQPHDLLYAIRMTLDIYKRVVDNRKNYHLIFDDFMERMHLVHCNNRDE